MSFPCFPAVQNVSKKCLTSIHDTRDCCAPEQTVESTLLTLFAWKFHLPDGTILNAYPKADACPDPYPKASATRVLLSPHNPSPLPPITGAHG